MNRFAVVDLGTNTCNLLIANILPDKSFETVFDRKLPVKLGGGVIHKGILQPEAIERGLHALKCHEETIREYGVRKLKVIGTSALRRAINKEEFLGKVKSSLGWEIEIIDGEQEADLIFRGVRLSLPDGIGKYLILDIGGGSIEFILANDSDYIWKKSFDVGIARAIETVKMSDPATISEIQAIEQFFNRSLPELWKVCEINQPQILVGCSGAFDTFMDIYEESEPDLKIRGVTEFPVEAFLKIHQQLIQSDHETRSKMAGMDKMRVEMIVIASVFTNFILRKIPVRRILHTHNALKEGAMDQLINNAL
jgi:exopolyphosphatase/guanosine-5'-triphosphate,3'-diphosphate pyrophosphatase